MVKTDSIKNGLLFGGLLGLLVAVPSISTWFLSFFSSLIPSSWLIFDSLFSGLSIKIFLIIIFAIIGALIDKI